MDPAAIETSDLTKSYGGQRGIEAVDLVVRRGEVFGFVGPNGAGKTTFIRTLLDLLRPTRGSARILGHDTQTESVEVRRLTGYVPGELSLHGNLTGRYLLRHIATLRRTGLDRATELCDRFHVELDRPIRTLSRGNKQKLGLVQAFLHDPDVLILDEPTAGLDPLMQNEFHRLVLETRRRGRTVFFSSHELPQLDKVCDRVGLIREGRLVTVQPPRELKRRLGRRIHAVFTAPVRASDFADVPGVRDLTVSGNELECVVVGPMDAFLERLAPYRVRDLTSEDADLEQTVLDLYQGPTHA